MCRRYMYNYLEIITTVTTILCIISNTQENLEKRKNSGNISEHMMRNYIRNLEQELWEL